MQLSNLESSSFSLLTLVKERNSCVRVLLSFSSTCSVFIAIAFDILPLMTIEDEHTTGKPVSTQRRAEREREEDVSPRASLSTERGRRETLLGIHCRKRREKGASST